MALLFPYFTGLPRIAHTPRCVAEDRLLYWGHPLEIETGTGDRRRLREMSECLTNPRSSWEDAVRSGWSATVGVHPSCNAIYIPAVTLGATQL